MRLRPHPPRLPARIAALAATLVAAPAAALLTGASSADAAPATAVTHTRIAVIRPVHADGRPVRGYSVTRERIAGFACQDASTVAVDAGIDFCGFSATNTMACWKSTNHTALCLRDPWAKALVRIRYAGVYRHFAAPRHPAPQGLRLVSGNRCWIRDGGAWSWVNGHPHWFGAYSCEYGDVYGTGDGVQESTQPWGVHLVVNAGMPNQRISNQQVRKAFFVGTAA